MHIVHLANFWSPTSGGIRTTLRALGRGYRLAGHRFTVVVPGPRSAVHDEDFGTVVELASPSVPSTGYRIVVRRDAVLLLLSRLRPDRIEVSDRFTLRGAGDWARSQGIPSVYFNHERLDLLLQQWKVPVRWALRLATAHNRSTAASFDAVVATTAFAATEFESLPGTRVVRVPLGVDLPVVRRSTRPGEAVRLVMCTRLSREKHPELAVDTVAELVRRGVDVQLVVAGDGPLRAALQHRSAGLPIRFLGHVADRALLLQEQAEADIALAPGPVETFGLAAVECLAAGTPVVVNRSSALAEILGSDPAGGRAVPGDPIAMADAVQDLLTVPVDRRRGAARRAVAELSWDRTVRDLLTLHGAA